MKFYITIFIFLLSNTVLAKIYKHDNLLFSTINGIAKYMKCKKDGCIFIEENGEVVAGFGDVLFLFPKEQILKCPELQFKAGTKEYRNSEEGKRMECRIITLYNTLSSEPHIKQVLEDGGIVIMPVWKNDFLGYSDVEINPIKIDLNPCIE